MAALEAGAQTSVFASKQSGHKSRARNTKQIKHDGEKTDPNKFGDFERFTTGVGSKVVAF
jgi:hypothetical protein